MIAMRTPTWHAKVATAERLRRDPRLGGGFCVQRRATVLRMKLSFYGGAEIVTGSNFMVEGANGKILLDCGIEQGKDFVESQMYAPFPYDVPSIDAVVVTHAHLDHVGRLPKLVKEGFRGKVYMTPPTRDLTELILRDSVDILAAEAHLQAL